MTASAPTILRLIDGLRFRTSRELWQIDPLRISLGQSIALSPSGTDPVTDPAIVLARILATLSEPERGMIELFGLPVYHIDSGKRQRLRARIGFVHGYGGLLFNRTVRENIALPLSVHSGLSARDEAYRVEHTLDEFALQPVADLLPHEMDGSTRWRACLARSLVLRPQWLVLEGLGNWEIDRGRGRGWSRLMERQKSGKLASVICLSRKNPGFESWFKEYGVVVPYQRYVESDETRS